MIQIRISKPRTFRSKHIKGIKKNTLGKDSLVHLIHHDLSDLQGSLILIRTIEMEFMHP